MLAVVILVLHTSRLFRNIALSRRYKDELPNKLNIEVLFVNQPVSDDPSGSMMETLNEMFDEHYLYQVRMWTSPHVVRAGEYLESLGMLWDQATLEEQRDITRVLITAAYVAVSNRIVAIEPKPIFKQLFVELCRDIGVDVQ